MAQIFTVTLPDIGEGVVEGEVIGWLKKTGDDLRQDEPVVIVMTDKATVELPAPYPGKLAKQYCQPGEIARRDKPLYDIELLTPIALNESSKPAAHSAPQKQKCVQEKTTTTMTRTEGVSSAPTEKGLAVPHVRRLAKELGIPIGDVTGSGKGGRITQDDLKVRQKSSSTAVLAPIARLPGDKEESIIGVRQLMGKRMAESKAHIPHFSYFEQVDASRLIQLRQSVKKEAAQSGLHVTYMPFIIRALSLCIKQYPHLNSVLDTVNHKLIIHHQQNIGIAVSTQWGLIVPVLKNVHDLTLEQIIRAYDELIYRAQNNQLLPSDMKDSTMTVSNYGGIGGSGRWATPIINYPEVAILGVARIQKQPVVKGDAIVIGDVLNLSWSFDHRIIDGDMAVKLSHYFCGLIQNPACLL